MNALTKYFFLFIFLFLFYSCEEERKLPNRGFFHGLFIVNEGNFMNNNGSISYFNPDSGKVINNVFQTVNQVILGDVVQSFAVADDKGFIVVNNSQKVEVVDMETFLSLGTITGTDYPRYFLHVSQSKGYLTNGSFAGKVFVIDLNTLSISKKIPVGNGPEHLVKSGGRVFVANSGGWTYDNTITVIDADTDAVTDTIAVGDNPIDLVVDKHRVIWVLCKGNVVYDQYWNIVDETDSEIYLINSDDLSVISSFVVGTAGDYFNPIRLACNKEGTLVYYLEVDGIYKMAITDTAPPANPFIQRSFYGLAIDQNTGTIIGLDAKGFLSDGYMFRYSLSGDLIDSLKVGVGPGSVVTN